MKEEKLKVEIDGSTFYYKRVPSHVRKRILRECTVPRNSRINNFRYEQKLMEEALLGWENVTELSGKTIPFSKKMIGYLPDKIQGELVKLFGESPKRGVPSLAELGNWISSRKFPVQSRRGKHRAEK